MDTVYFDAVMPDEQRRAELYRGQLFVLSQTKATIALVEFAKGMIVEAFGGLDPEIAQRQMPVEKYAELLGDLKPRFIHHPTSKELIRSILMEYGCDPEKTYFDVPRMRTATSDNYLSTGIAYAFHPHRDTWYSAPMCQLNWWMPIYEIVSGNAMAFHPKHWDSPVRNSSREYNYQEWNKKSRFVAVQQVKADTRKQPMPEEPVELDPQVRIVAKPGQVLVFSGAHLHSTVPNTTGKTRFSIDFRTIHIDDVRNHLGARNVDSECTGSTMGDYLRCTDFSHLPPEATADYDAGPPQLPSFSSKTKS
jgi:hypothetical protein